MPGVACSDMRLGSLRAGGHESIGRARGASTALAGRVRILIPKSGTHGVSGPRSTRRATAASPSMRALSARLDRPQRPRYITGNGAEIDATAVPGPSVQLVAPGTWKVTALSGWRHPVQSQLARREHCQDLVDTVEHEVVASAGISRPSAWQASTRWMACSWACRRSQNRAVRGGGPKFQHSLSGSSAVIVSRKGAVPAEKPGRGALGRRCRFLDKGARPNHRGGPSSRLNRDARRVARASSPGTPERRGQACPAAAGRACRGGPGSWPVRPGIDRATWEEPNATPGQSAARAGMLGRFRAPGK